MIEKGADVDARNSRLLDKEYLSTDENKGLVYYNVYIGNLLELAIASNSLERVKFLIEEKGIVKENTSNFEYNIERRFRFYLHVTH